MVNNTPHQVNAAKRRLQRSLLVTVPHNIRYCNTRYRSSCNELLLALIDVSNTQNKYQWANVKTTKLCAVHVSERISMATAIFAVSKLAITKFSVVTNTMQPSLFSILQQKFFQWQILIYLLSYATHIDTLHITLSLEKHAAVETRSLWQTKPQIKHTLCDRLRCR